MQPLQREFHGHQIVSSADMRRHEVFKGTETIGVHETLGSAIAQARGPRAHRFVNDEPDEPLPLEAVAIDSDGVMKPIDELSGEDSTDG